MKAYTDLEQSKKLAEILPLDSADMCYLNDGTAIKIDANPYTVLYSMWKDCIVEFIPCWSLAALLDIIPSGKALIHDKWDLTYKCICNNIDTSYFNNPVDACYEMIVKLYDEETLH